MSFKAEFTRLQKRVKKTNVDKGFNEIDNMIDTLSEITDPRVQDVLPALKNARTGLKLMLVVSELGEALEHLRKGNPPDNHIPKFSGFAAELADAIIRLMNLASDEKEPLADAIIAKAVYNDSRPHKHGGKLF